MSCVSSFLTYFIVYYLVCVFLATKVIIGKLGGCLPSLAPVEVKISGSPTKSGGSQPLQLIRPSWGGLKKYLSSDPTSTN
jgi:hypothetical protein